MQELLIKKLLEYLVVNHPDVFVLLQQEGEVTMYLEAKVQALEEFAAVLLAAGKPVYIVEELCMDALTRELGPSKFNYLSTILEEEFKAEYDEWQETGILIYEVINLIDVCAPVFDAYGFNEASEDAKFLRYAIIGIIREYVTDNQ